MPSVRDEIPDTEHGITFYYNLSIRQIRENKNHIKRLETRMEWCQKKADAMGFKIDVRT